MNFLLSRKIGAGVYLTGGEGGGGATTNVPQYGRSECTSIPIRDFKVLTHVTIILVLLPFKELMSYPTEKCELSATLLYSPGYELLWLSISLKICCL